MAKNNKPTTAIDQSAIPRPLNCFLMYRLEKQKEIVAKCSGANHRDISKIIAKWWQEAPEEKKRPFRERARIAKAEHRKLYPDYKYTPKKKVTPKRVYIRKNKKEQFTSRASENNKIMELIYDDPSALENMNGVETVSNKASSTPKASKVTKKSKTIDKKREANTVVMENVYEDYSDDYIDFDFKECHPSFQYSNSVSSTQTVPDFYFDSPQATNSPFTDCYSEYDMQSPYAGSSPLDNFQLSYPMVIPSSSSAPVFSAATVAAEPFDLLDTSFITDFNTYTSMPLESQLDYFQLDTSSNINLNIDLNITNNNISEYPQEFCWTECPDYIFTQECQNSIMVQMSQPIGQYINPSVLYNM